MDSDSSASGQRIAPSITRRAFLAGAAATGIGLASYSGTHARHEFEVTHRNFALANLPDAFVGMRLVQMSDIHLEEYTETWFLEKMVEQVNALDPEDHPDYRRLRQPRSSDVAIRCLASRGRLRGDPFHSEGSPHRYAILGQPRRGGRREPRHRSAGSPRDPRAGRQLRPDRARKRLPLAYAAPMTQALATRTSTWPFRRTPGGRSF